MSQECPNNINCERFPSTVNFKSEALTTAIHQYVTDIVRARCPVTLGERFNVNVNLRSCRCSCYTATVNLYEEIVGSTIVILDNSPEWEHIGTSTNSTYSYSSSSPYVIVSYLPPPFDFTPPCGDDFTNFDDNTCSNYNINIEYLETQMRCRNLQVINSIQSNYTFPYSIYYNDNRHLDVFATYSIYAIAIANEDLSYIAITIHIHSLLCAICYLFYTYALVEAISNTKEDVEVLKGLWGGKYYYNELHDTHIVKRSKLIDMIP